MSDEEKKEEPAKEARKAIVLPFPVLFERKRFYDRSTDELGPELVAQKEEIPRVCLRCDKKFIAPSRFVRLCPACGKWAAYVHTPNIEGW